MGKANAREHRYYYIEPDHAPTEGAAINPKSAHLEKGVVVGPLLRLTGHPRRRGRAAASPRRTSRTPHHTRGAGELRIIHRPIPLLLTKRE